MCGCGSNVAFNNFIPGRGNGPMGQKGKDAWAKIQQNKAKIQKALQQKNLQHKIAYQMFIKAKMEQAKKKK